MNNKVTNGRPAEQLTPAGPADTFHTIIRIYIRVLRWLVLFFAAIAGLGVLAMMGIMVAEVVLSLFNHPIVGVYDLVKLAGAITMAGALPYTTAVKGHVAIEFFYHQLGRRGRRTLDISIRIVMMFLTAFAAWQSVLYGNNLKAVGQGTQTMQIPMFWVPWLIAVTFVLVTLVILHNMLNPGREMIKP